LLTARDFPAPFLFEREVRLPSKAMSIARRDNDWLRLTSDDRRKFRAFDRSVAMRSFFLAAMMFGAVTGAQAADMPDFLRGTVPASNTPTRNWDGWYAGGQVGYSSAADDFSKSLTGLTDKMFTNSVLQPVTSQLSALTKSNTQGTGFGAFVGRNWQWDDVVLGVEANYNYINLSASSTNTTPALSYGFQDPTPNITDNYTIQLSGTAAAQIKDAITFRGRAGWACGDFLPYMFGGLAVGRMDVSRSAGNNVSLQQFITSTNTVNIGGVPVTSTTTTRLGNPVNVSAPPQSQERTDNYVVGWTAGLGLEYMLWGNIFVRGEWEYTKFISVENTNVTLNSARAGIGYKF
jgi:outer membrane immunogenic protein